MRTFFESSFVQAILLVMIVVGWANIIMWIFR